MCIFVGVVLSAILLVLTMQPDSQNTGLNLYGFSFSKFEAMMHM